MTTETKGNQFIDYLRNCLNPLLHSLAETFIAQKLISVNWLARPAFLHLLLHPVGYTFLGTECNVPGRKGLLHQAFISSCIPLLDGPNKQAFNVCLETQKTQGHVCRNLRF